MSGGRSQELRPRSPVELYDAALHLCVRTRSALPVLALLGATPVAASVLWLVWSAEHGGPVAPACALTAAALVFRQVCQGAGGLAATRELEGEPASALNALRAALARLPSFVTCTLLLAALQWVVLPLTLGLSLLFASLPLTGPVLIAEGSAHGWNFPWVARQRLRGRGQAAVVLRLLHGLALFLLVANLHGSLLAILYLAHALFAADVSFLEQFASLSHGFYDLCLIAAAQVLLDPVRCATSALLLADARVRREAFDLLATLRGIREGTGRVAALLLVILAVGLGQTARAAEAKVPEDPAAALASLAARLGVDGEPAVRDGLRDAERLSGEGRASLAPLVRDLEGELGRKDPARAATMLRAALAELPTSNRGSAAQRRLGHGARAAAQRILSRPEFQSTGTQVKSKTDDARLAPGWWTRFCDWLQRQLDKLLKKNESKPYVPPPGGYGLGGGVAEVLTYGLVLLAVGVLGVVLHGRFARGGRRAGEAAGGQAAGEGDAQALDALAKTSWAWSQEADALAAEGRFREAIRALYLALLAALHRRGQIDYHPALSNWAYCERFQGPLEAREDLRDLTQRFDFGWYGRMGADGPGYARFRLLSGPLIQGDAQKEVEGG